MAKHAPAEVIVFHEKPEIRAAASLIISIAGRTPRTFDRAGLAYQNLTCKVTGLVTTLETDETNRDDARWLLERARKSDLDIPVAVLVTQPLVALRLDTNKVGTIIEAGDMRGLQTGLDIWLKNSQETYSMAS